MSDWSIKIVPASSGGGAAFVPDLQGYDPGDPLPAQQDDLVCWNNTTNQTHQPWKTDENYVPIPDSQAPRGSQDYLSDPIPPKQSSRPSYDTAPPAGNPDSWTVYYYCKLHPTVESERGTIDVTAVPSS